MSSAGARRCSANLCSQRRRWPPPRLWPNPTCPGSRLTARPTRAAQRAHRPRRMRVRPAWRTVAGGCAEPCAMRSVATSATPLATTRSRPLPPVPRHCRCRGAHNAMSAGPPRDQSHQRLLGWLWRHDGCSAGLAHWERGCPHTVACVVDGLSTLLVMKLKREGQVVRCACLGGASRWV